jgi:hypothetical protein
VRLQSSVTHALRHEGDTLVQVSVSSLSTSTLVQRAGARTSAADLFGRPVTLDTRWEEGGVWVVDVVGNGACVQMRRWLERDGAMCFDIHTTPLRRFERRAAAALAPGGGGGAASQGAPRVTMRRRLHRVSAAPDGAPPVAEAERAAGRPGRMWRIVFGSWTPPLEETADEDATTPRCC